jgi:hypothetical protein
MLRNLDQEAHRESFCCNIIGALICTGTVVGLVNMIFFSKHSAAEPKAEVVNKSVVQDTFLNNTEVTTNEHEQPVEMYETGKFDIFNFTQDWL